MENLQIFENANPSFAEMFAAMRGNAAAQAQWQSHPAPTHTGKPRPADVAEEAEHTMRTQKTFSSDGFGSPKRRDYRSKATIPAPQETRPAKPTVKTGRPAKDRYLGQVDGDFLYRMELAKYARTQASLYMQGDRLPALHEVLWAVATRFFPQPVISYMNREITCQGAPPVAYIKRDALNTLQALLPCFLAEIKGNTLKLTVPPQGDSDRDADMNVIDGLLDAAALLDAVTRRTRCQADEALTAVDMMDGADVADLIIETTPCLADEAWEDYAERLLTHAPAMTGRLREVVTEKLMTIPAVKASVAPDNMEA